MESNQMLMNSYLNSSKNFRVWIWIWICSFKFGSKLNIPPRSIIKYWMFMNIKLYLYLQKNMLKLFVDMLNIWFSVVFEHNPFHHVNQLKFLLYQIGIKHLFTIYISWHRIYPQKDRAWTRPPAKVAIRQLL